MQTKENEKQLWEYAADIREDWKNMAFCAEPYVDAMSQLDTLDDTYIMDPAADIVLRFLCNAQTWKGEVARKTKKELNTMVKEHNKRKRNK